MRVHCVLIGHRGDRGHLARILAAVLRADRLLQDIAILVSERLSTGQLTDDHAILDASVTGL